MSSNNRQGNMAPPASQGQASRSAPQHEPYQTINGVPMRPWRHGSRLPIPDGCCDIDVLAQVTTTRLAEEEAASKRREALDDMRALMGADFMARVWPPIERSALGDQIIENGFRGPRTGEWCCPSLKPRWPWPCALTAVHINR
ncbi:hypothetical protein PT974_03735 [Cladobotryum mycophilum]|uniref:Uncharacterized protein n=1 Tax=Cladobotryum mycophilum TaxID=491253 RepID=A0ABR0SUC4_9HYPO